jgi:hypothetical protein
MAGRDQKGVLQVRRGVGARGWPSTATRLHSRAARPACRLVCSLASRAAHPLACCSATTPPCHHLPPQVVSDRLAARWAEVSKSASRIYARAAPVRSAAPRRVTSVKGEPCGSVTCASPLTSAPAPLARACPLPLRALQSIQLASDYAWFLGSSALLLSLPIVVEIQREATVLVLQRQREAEIAQMQEQARALNASTLDNLRATASMMLGSGPAPPGGAPADEKR